MDTSNTKYLLDFVSNKFYSEIRAFCITNKLFHLVLEEKGIFSIIEKTTNILLEKRPELLKLENWDSESIDRYYISISKNVIRNYSRDKLINQYSIIRSKTIQIEDIGETSVSTYSLISESPKENSEDQVIKKLIETTEKLYALLSVGKITRCNGLIRYYRKLLELLGHSHLRIIYNSNLHLFFATLYFDTGKLGLSKKHVEESISLYNSANYLIGHEFISNAYNLLGLIELNQKEYFAGAKTFEHNIKELEKVTFYNASTINQFALAKSRLLYGMFSGNIPSIHAGKVFQDSLEIDFPEKEKIFKTYVRIYLNVDKNYSENAIELIDEIKIDENKFDSASTLNQVRFYVAQAEIFTFGFSINTQKEIDLVLYYCEKATISNTQAKSKYFESIISIIRGYATKNHNIIKDGLLSLKKQGYFHYYEWYKRKILG